MIDPHDDSPSSSATQDAIAVLVENHRQLLRYVERRVGSREIAEDILQDAFVRSLDATASIPEEALVPWFYRVLRNAVIDRYRRRAVAEKALEAFAHEVQTATEVSPELEDEICRCVSHLADTLKPEYRQALQQIDVEGTGVKAFAEQQGLSAANAGVRVHRARQALKKRVTESCATCAEHGCLSCTCGSTTARG